MIRTMAIVPVRGKPVGKTRLAGVFGEAERAAMVEAMAWHVISTIQRTGVAERTVIVSEHSPIGLPSNHSFSDLEFIVQPGNAPGLNAALDAGRRWAVGNGADRLLVMSADLPLLEIADVHELADRRAPVVIAPDRFATGTNGLMLGDPRWANRDVAALFTFQFGLGSFQRHLAEAKRFGVPVDTASVRGTSFDLDTPDDWSRLPADVQHRLLGATDDAPDPIATALGSLPERGDDWAESA